MAHYVSSKPEIYTTWRDVTVSNSEEVDRVVTVESQDNLVKCWIGFGEVECASGLPGCLRFAATGPGNLWATRGQIAVASTSRRSEAQWWRAIDQTP